MKTITVKNKRFPAQDFECGETHDIIQLCRPDYHYIFENCIVAGNLVSGPMDEAVGITHGATATFKHCLFHGARKLVLIGSGDEDFKEEDKRTTVDFYDCWFDSFGRRGPEIQSGAQVAMRDCVISNWGDTDHWDTRSFGIWVHDRGFLDIKYCYFTQGIKPSLSYRIKDLANHIGQAVNDHGVRALLQWRTYVPGWRRGCVASDTGMILASHCYRESKDIIIDCLVDELDDDVGQSQIDSITMYFNWLNTKQAKTSNF